MKSIRKGEGDKVGRTYGKSKFLGLVLTSFDIFD